MTFPRLNPRDPRAGRTLRARQLILMRRYQALDEYLALTAELCSAMLARADRAEEQLARDVDQLGKDAESLHKHLSRKNGA